MRLILDELEIENRQLNTVFLTHDQELWFKGIALDKEGKDLCDRLFKFKKGDIVEVEAENRSYDLFEGVCKILEIETTPPENTDIAPLIYRFSGKLKPVW